MVFLALFVLATSLTDASINSVPLRITGAMCTSDCSGLPMGRYQSCEGCNKYAVCLEDLLLDIYSCPAGTVWDDIIKSCEQLSSTCSDGSISPTTVPTEVPTLRTSTVVPTPKKGIIYIVGLDETLAFSITSTGEVQQSSEHWQGFDTGCLGCAYSSHDNKLYMSGLVRPSPSMNLPGNVTSVFSEPETYTSETKLPLEGRRYSSYPFSFIINDRLYVAEANRESGLERHKTVYSRSLISGSTWKREVDLPGDMRFTSRSGVVFKNVVYITGGVYKLSDSNKVFKWTPGLSTWKDVSSMKYARHWHCNVLVNNRFIYVLGGSRYEIEVYDITSDSWSVRGKSPNLANNPSCSAIGSVIYVYHYPSLYKYDTEAEQWQEIYTDWDSGSIGAAMLIV